MKAWSLGSQRGGGEPSAIEWLIAQGVVDRVRLQALPAIKRRRLEQTALEVQQAPAIKRHVGRHDRPLVAEMRRNVPADKGVHGRGVGHGFRHRRQPTVHGPKRGPPGYHVVFTKRQIFQVDGLTQTRRPVRRLELSWGEDSVVTYANDDSSE